MKKCKLGADGRCTGCGRTLAEIEAAGTTKEPSPMSEKNLPAVVLERRAIAEELLCRALRDAGDMVYNQTGIRLDTAQLEWSRLATGEHRVRKVLVTTTTTERRPA